MSSVKKSVPPKSHAERLVMMEETNAEAKRKRDNDETSSLIGETGSVCSDTSSASWMYPLNIGDFGGDIESWTEAKKKRRALAEAATAESSAPLELSGTSTTPTAPTSRIIQRVVDTVKKTATIKRKKKEENKEMKKEKRNRQVQEEDDKDNSEVDITLPLPVLGNVTGVHHKEGVAGHDQQEGPQPPLLDLQTGAEPQTPQAESSQLFWSTPFDKDENGEEIVDERGKDFEQNIVGVTVGDPFPAWLNEILENWETINVQDPNQIFGDFYGEGIAEDIKSWFPFSKNPKLENDSYVEEPDQLPEDLSKVKVDVLRSWCHRRSLEIYDTETGKLKKKPVLQKMINDILISPPKTKKCYVRLERRAFPWLYETRMGQEQEQEEEEEEVTVPLETGPTQEEDSEKEPRLAINEMLTAMHIQPPDKQEEEAPVVSLDNGLGNILEDYDEEPQVLESEAAVSAQYSENDDKRIEDVQTSQKILSSRSERDENQSQESEGKSQESDITDDKRRNSLQPYVLDPDHRSEIDKDSVQSSLMTQIDGSVAPKSTQPSLESLRKKVAKIYE